MVLDDGRDGIARGGYDNFKEWVAYDGHKSDQRCTGNKSKAQKEIADQADYQAELLVLLYEDF